MTSQEIIEALGGATKVARLCGVSAQAVSQWHGIDPKTGLQREIPSARLMYLKVVRPSAFKKVAAAKEVAPHA